MDVFSLSRLILEIILEDITTDKHDSHEATQYTIISKLDKHYDGITLEVFTNRTSRYIYAEPEVYRGFNNLMEYCNSKEDPDLEKQKYKLNYNIVIQFFDPKTRENLLSLSIDIIRKVIVIDLTNNINQQLIYSRNYDNILISDEDILENVLRQQYSVKNDKFTEIYNKLKE